MWRNISYVLIGLAIWLNACTSSSTEQAPQSRYQTELPKSFVDSLEQSHLRYFNFYYTTQSKAEIIQQLEDDQSAYVGQITFEIAQIAPEWIVVKFPPNHAKEYGNWDPYGRLGYVYHCGKKFCAPDYYGLTLTLDTVGGMTNIALFDDAVFKLQEFCEVPLYFKDGRNFTKLSCRPEVYKEFPFATHRYDELLSRAGLQEAQLMDDSLPYTKHVMGSEEPSSE